jgi:signal transduction histidine kinase
MTPSLFDRLFKTSGSIQRTLRHVEWTMLTFYVLTLPMTPYIEFKSPIILVIVSLLVLSGLSWIFPIDRPLWQRRIYIGATIIPLILSRSGNWNLSFLLNLTVLKSCFLLGRRETIIVTIISCISWIAPLMWLIPDNDYIHEQILSRIVHDRLIPFQYLSEISDCIVVSTFILLFGFLIVKEQQNQQQIKSLNQEVEALGTLLERAKIARNIHDTLGHTLTALGMQLEVAQQICRSQPEQTFQRLTTARMLTDECFQDIRSVVTGLRQSDFDLVQGLTGLMTHLQQTQSISTKIQLDLPTLTLQTSYQIYCIIQEGITNIQKHSNATCVNLQTEISAEALIIELCDDGQGFDLADPTDGFGLKGMRERLQLIGGMLQINTAPGQGTQLRIVILRCGEVQ